MQVSSITKRFSSTYGKSFYLRGLGKFNMPENQKYVVQYLNKKHEIIDKKNHYKFPIAEKCTNVFAGKQTYKSSNLKIIDSNSEKNVISIRFNYHVHNHIHYPDKYTLFDLFDKNYIFAQVEIILKDCLSKYKLHQLTSNKIDLILKRELQYIFHNTGVIIDDVYVKIL